MRQVIITIILITIGIHAKDEHYIHTFSSLFSVWLNQNEQRNQNINVQRANQEVQQPENQEEEPIVPQRTSYPQQLKNFMYQHRHFLAFKALSTILDHTGNTPNYYGYYALKAPFFIPMQFKMKNSPSRNAEE